MTSPPSLLLEVGDVAADASEWNSMAIIGAVFVVFVLGVVCTAAVKCVYKRCRQQTTSKLVEPSSSYTSRSQSNRSSVSNDRNYVRKPGPLHSTTNSGEDNPLLPDSSPADFTQEDESKLPAPTRSTATSLSTLVDDAPGHRSHSTADWSGSAREEVACPITCSNGSSEELHLGFTKQPSQTSVCADIAPSSLASVSQDDDNEDIAVQDEELNGHMGR